MTARSYPPFAPGDKVTVKNRHHVPRGLMFGEIYRVDDSSEAHGIRGLNEYIMFMEHGWYNVELFRMADDVGSVMEDAAREYEDIQLAQAIMDDLASPQD